MSVISSSLVDYILEAACSIQQIQAPTFHEGPRAEWLRKRFLYEGLANVFCDEKGNLFGQIPGGNLPSLIISAHLDTVHPLQDALPLSRFEDRICGPGIGDDSLGLAALIAVIVWGRENQLIPRGDIWLVATVGEEGLGNLRGMKAVVDRFGSQPMAYLAVEGIGLGNLDHRGLGVERFRISTQTAGGHSWADYGAPSAIHELARLVAQLSALPIPKNPRTTLNVGTIHGGIAVNCIAAEAWMELDLRSEDQQALSQLIKRVQQKIHKLESSDVQVRMELIGSRPAGEIPADHKLVQLAQDLLNQIGITPHLGIASTDANIPLSRGFPALCFGLTNGGSTHTSNEFIQIQPLGKGLEFLFTLTRNIWKLF